MHLSSSSSRHSRSSNNSNNNNIINSLKKPCWSTDGLHNKQTSVLKEVVYDFATPILTEQ